MALTPRHWALAFLAALLVHAGLLTAYLWQPPDPGAAAAGSGGIEVSLGPAGGAPGSIAGTADPIVEAEATEPAEPAPVNDAMPETRPARPIVEEVVVAEVMPPDPAWPVPRPDIAPVEDPVVETVEPPSVETTPRPRTTDDEAMAELAMLSEPDVTPHPMAAALAAPAVEPEEAAEPVVMIAAPLPASKPDPAPSPQSPSDPQPVSSSAPTEVAPTPVKATAGSMEGAGGESGAQDNPDAGAAARNSTGGGTPGLAADYVALLQAWLEKHKEYPYRAQVRREEGVALLFFVLDRDGRVLEFRITQSSGSELLDQEVADMIERAQPLPRMPDSMTQTRLKLVVPVQFFLQ